MLPKAMMPQALRDDPEQHSLAEELARPVRSGRSGFEAATVHDNPECPDIIIAYEQDGTVYAHNVDDAYPRTVDAETTFRHAELMRELACRQQPERAAAFWSAAGRLASRACQELQHVPTETMVRLTCLVADLTGDTGDLLRTITEELTGEVPHLTRQIVGWTQAAAPQTTCEQARNIISAAQAEGLPNGTLQNLCRAMGLEPDEIGLPEPRQEWDDVRDILEMGLEMEVSELALAAVATGLGYCADDPDLDAWLRLKSLGPYSPHTE